MMPENYQLLITKLTERTVNRDALWEKTSREEEFRLQLNSSVITIDKWFDSFEGKVYYDLAIYNEDGHQIDKIGCSDTTDGYKLLKALHSAVSRIHYKVDETFKSIFEELDSANKIGKVSPPTHDDSDIPF
ncbi:MAG: hypothetical protein V4642_05715 [Bacteroidota bacterium]